MRSLIGLPQRRRTYKDKVALVTGAAGGLGRALCQDLARQGARVAAMDLDVEGLEELARDLERAGTECLSLPGDITDQAYCEEAVQTTKERLGGLDLLINNAGLTQRSAFVDTAPDVFRRVMEVNFFGSLYCARAALPALLQSRGQIVVVSSIAGFAPLYGRSGYAASKHALHGLFESLRSELHNTGVSLLMACPGFIDTPFAQNALDGDGSVTSHPRSTVGKQITAEEVSKAILRAASRGQTLLVLTPVGHLTRLLTRVSPSLYQRLMIRSLGQELER